MTELVAPFVPVHGSWTFLPDMNCLLDPSGSKVLFGCFDEIFISVGFV